MIEIKINKDFVKYSFLNDGDNNRLRLLVTLSPIFIACFDNGNYELEFLKNTIKKSDYPYGLYPNFFEGFDKDSYFKTYENKKSNEDIILKRDGSIDFYVNPMEEKYIIALKNLIEGLILDSEVNKYWNDYFKKMRNDIVINGRRSIIANGIQGFYLNKYVLVWMMDLCDYIKENNPNLYEDILPIYHLSSNLKTMVDSKNQNK
ncbi:hypothetical protein [Anaerococcus cruorum]|uniref:hypothetical protein n=1 Tax=Anaerococcus sp. WGS1529 TaxID=3366812 RepID=UPI00372D2B73